MDRTEQAAGVVGGYVEDSRRRTDRRWREGRWEGFWDRLLVESKVPVREIGSDMSAPNAERLSAPEPCTPAT